MILVIDCGSSKTPYIADAVDANSEVEVVPFFDLTEQKAIEAKGLIFSGAPILVTERNMDDFLEHIDWLKSYPKPVLGICFGHQILGMLFGVLPSRMKEDRDWQEIEVLIDCPLFKRLPDVFEMMEDHCESIPVPHGFDLVASSDACVNEAMQHKSLPFYGVQFHPEVSGNFGAMVIDNFCELCL
jgi:GMP synthase (glutamine-hydrolysing)